MTDREDRPMSDFLPAECVGCQAPIAPAVGVYYCGSCVAKQLALHASEREAFDAYHAFADECARRSV